MFVTEPELHLKLPTKATGGCLCGAIRYTIKFPVGHNFSANSCKCFCTACRKNSGALFLHFHAVPLSHFSCTAPISALGDYSCSPGCHRLFCKFCGSFIAWQQDPMKNEDLHNSANFFGSKEERKARERGRAVNGDGKGALGGVISGRRGDVRQGVNVNGVREDFVMVNGPPESSSSPRSDKSKCCAREARNINRVWEEEGEVEVCVGTLDEEFLVGRRGKDKNVIPGTGFGALVAHPEGRVLWGENDIVGATDAVTGVRWKYGVTAGVRLPFHRDH